MDYLPYMWTTMVQLFYSGYISVDLAHCEIVGKDGINPYNLYYHLSIRFLKSVTVNTFYIKRFEVLAGLDT